MTENKVCKRNFGLIKQTLVNGKANIGQAKLIETVILVVRLLLCTLITVGGYFLVYHRMARYQDAKEWVRTRYSLIRRNDEKSNSEG